jgi:hypothetical protein
MPVPTKAVDHTSITRTARMRDCNGWGRLPHPAAVNALAVKGRRIVVPMTVR